MYFKLVFSWVVIISASLSAHASDAQECKKKLDSARTSLVSMLNGKKDDAQQKLVTSTASEMTSCLDAMTVNGKTNELNELKKVWSAFKATREAELVPLILSSKKEDNEKAKTIATGIQKERMDKMNSLFEKLNGGDL